MGKRDWALWKLLFLVTGAALLPPLGTGFADYIVDGAERVTSREYLLPRVILWGGWGIFLVVVSIRSARKPDEPSE